MSFPPIAVSFDPEDLVSLIAFIDTFLPQIDTTDEESRAVALCIWEQRELMRKALPDEGEDVVMFGEKPC